MKTSRAGVVALAALGVIGPGCGHRTSLKGTNDATEPDAEAADAATADAAEARSETAEAGSETAEAPSIVGACVTADDCVPVLDYRAGFSCLAPKAASMADVARDPCLIPWKPNPKCSTEAPPAECPGGEIPVQHSCFAIGCTMSACTDGKCSFTIGVGTQCPPASTDAAPPDCETLRLALVNALVAAQECDPAQSSSSCDGDYADTCGCEAPYNLSGPRAKAVQCAFDAWAGARCPLASCGKTCVRPTKAGATCVPNATGSKGTCAWL